MNDPAAAGNPTCGYRDFGDRQCLFAAEEGKDRCVFHLPVEEKTPKQFWRHLASYLKALLDNAGNEKTAAWQKQNPDHWILHDADPTLVAGYARAILSKPEESRNWRFTGFIFPEMDKVHNFHLFVFGTADFRDARFSGTADFSGARFSDRADFRNAQFSDTADFEHARFRGAADFYGAQFSDTAGFSGAQSSAARQTSLARGSATELTSGMRSSAARLI